MDDRRLAQPRPTDPGYVERLIDGDPEAWRRFSLREWQFMEWVCTQTRERSGLPFSAQEIADDVAQALARMLDHDRKLLRRFDGRSRLSTYVGIIARSATLDRLRSGARLRRVESAPARPGQPPAQPMDELVWNEKLAALREAKESLAPEVRQVVEAFYGKGLTYPVISQQLGISLQEVKSRLASARLQLAAALKENA